MPRPNISVPCASMIGTLFWRHSNHIFKWHERRKCSKSIRGGHSPDLVKFPDFSRYFPRRHWLTERGLTSPPTHYRLSGRQFYRSKDQTNSIKVLKEKLASHSMEENPPGASHRVTSEPLKKEKPYHIGSSPARQSPTQQALICTKSLEVYRQTYVYS